MILGRKTPASVGPVTLADLERMREFMARLIIRYGPGGEKFLPIFQRLERECLAARAHEETLRAVRDLAGLGDACNPHPDKPRHHPRRTAPKGRRRRSGGNA